MPEHVHLLLGENGPVGPAKIVQIFKQRVSRRMRGKKRVPAGQLALRFPEKEATFRRFGQRRYYDFNVYTRAKLKEKLDYMHANPLTKKLVTHPRDWPWSSWQFYTSGKGIIKVDTM